MSERMQKVNAMLSRAITEVITYELSNPLISGIITVTDVDTSNNLEYCKVSVSIMTDGDREEVFNNILHSAGFIRKEVCKKVDLRKMPFLDFRLDKSGDYATKIDNLIKDIEKDRNKNIDENK